MKTLAGALVLGFAAVASAAHAGTTLVGGGATLPALGYGGDVTHRQITPIAGSFLAVYSAQTGNPQTSYCQTGSGAGKNILAGGTISGTTYNVQNSCPDGSATPTGFGAATAGRSDLTQPNFAGADSPLNATDYSNYRANRSTSYPVEFPAVAGSIAIAYNKSGVSSLNLTDSQICQVFSGQITDWSQLVPGVSGAINVVYRSDGSGTSFGFSNHLAAVCGSINGHTFVTDQSFKNVVAQFLPTLPSNWVPESGNPNVANYVAGNLNNNPEGTIAYVEAANAQSVLNAWATVNGKDPFADFGSALLPISSSSINYNKVISGVDANGRPTMAAISGAPATQCIALVDPSTYANPSSGYPIVAVSYLLANSANNGSDKTAVQNLMWGPYDSNIAGSSSLNTIGAGTGLSFLSTSFTKTQVQGCIN